MERERTERARLRAFILKCGLERWVWGVCSFLVLRFLSDDDAFCLKFYSVGGRALIKTFRRRIAR